MSKNTVHITAIALAITLTTASCNDTDTATIPRRKAYPRPPEIDTIMTAIPGLPVHLEANVAAQTTIPQPGWADITYPQYGATIHITVSSATPDNIDKIKANRMERLMLNAGDRASYNHEFTNSQGYDIIIVQTEKTSTPLQFLATDDSSVVISGAVYLPDPKAATATDSIAPAIEFIRKDIIRSMTALKPIQK